MEPGYHTGRRPGQLRDVRQCGRAGVSRFQLAVRECAGGAEGGLESAVSNGVGRGVYFATHREACFGETIADLRQISQWVHDCREPDGSPRYSGVRYLSRHDVSWECWAVFDRTSIVELERHAIRADDPSLKTVAARWTIAIEPGHAALA